MNILIFDDSKIHRAAAQLLLGNEHNLTIVDNYDAAEEALSTNIDYDRYYVLQKDKLGAYPKEGTKEEQTAYTQASAELQEQARRRPNFDVVLTDLLVPASKKAQGPEGYKFVGTEMPLGTIIALRALGAGIKKVAVVTDMNHHNHPASAAFDGFSPFSVGDIKVICTNRVWSVSMDAVTNELVSPEFLSSEEGKVKYPYPEGKTYGERAGLAHGKDWKQVLGQLTGEVQES